MTKVRGNIRIMAGSRQGEVLKDHQAKLEQSYWENDVLFNVKDLNARTPE